LNNYAYMSISIQSAPRTTLLIGNLPDAAGVETVQGLFNGLGRVISITLLADGFAFADLSATDAERALIHLKGTRLNGKLVMIDEAHPRRPTRY
jgi:hypothetical protein